MKNTTLQSDIPIIATGGNGHRTVNFDACQVVPAGYKGVITVGITDMDDNAVFEEYDSITRTFDLGPCVYSWLQYS